MFRTIKEVFTENSTFHNFTSEIEKLLRDYKTNLFTETKPVPAAEKRAQIAQKCAEAALYCLKSSLPANLLSWEAANFASNGLYIDPYNEDIYEILIELFETEIKLANEIKEQEFKPDEETVLQRDIFAVSLIKKFCQSSKEETASSKFLLYCSDKGTSIV